MKEIPKDPFILVSYVNTQLRDFYPSLEAMCEGLDIDCKELVEKLEIAGFRYQISQNRFS